MPEILATLVSNPLVAILTLLTIVLLAILFRDRSITLRLGDKELVIKKSSSSEKVPVEVKEEPDNKRCGACRMRIFEATKKRVKTIIRIREDLYNAQVKYSDNKLDFLTQKITDDYISLLSKYKESSDYKMESSFLLYRYKVLSFRYNVLGDRVETLIRENHILDKSTEQWKDHKQQFLEGLRAEMGQFVDTQHRSEEVPREALESFHEDRWPFISGKIVEILDHARSLALEYEIKIKEVKNHSNADIFGIQD
jgi:hypothetical protein